MLEAAQRATGADTEQGARAAGAVPLLGRGCGEGGLGSVGGGAAGASRWRSLVASGANLLILDEPTNHLDLESREALEDALRAFDGALLLVSHDRALLDAVGTRTIALEDGRLHSYAGGWADYVRTREERRAAEDAARRAGRPGNGRRRAGQAARPAVSKNAKRRIAELERAVEEAEAALAGVEDELADPGCWSTPDRSAESTERHGAAKRRVEELYEELGTLGISLRALAMMDPVSTTTEGRPARASVTLREEESVTPLELFFDLVFVLALTQCTALMADNPTWVGLAQGLLLLGVLWWSWVGYAWLTSVVDPEEGVVRLAIFAAMAALLVVALCVPEAFGDLGLLFAVRLRGRAGRPHRAVHAGQP